MKNPHKLFQSKDFGISCFIYAHQIPFCGIVPENDHYVFQFEDPEKCAQLEAEYWKGAKVNVQSFVNSQKTLKGILFQQKGR